jgi:hypothetical protein
MHKEIAQEFIFTGLSPDDIRNTKLSVIPESFKLAKIMRKAFNLAATRQAQGELNVKNSMQLFVLSI